MSRPQLTNVLHLRRIGATAIVPAAPITWSARINISLIDIEKADNQQISQVQRVNLKENEHKPAQQDQILEARAGLEQSAESMMKLFGQSLQVQRVEAPITGLERLRSDESSSLAHPHAPVYSSVSPKMQGNKRATLRLFGTAITPPVKLFGQDLTQAPLVRESGSPAARQSPESSSDTLDNVTTPVSAPAPARLRSTTGIVHEVEHGLALTPTSTVDNLETTAAAVLDHSTRGASGPLHHPLIATGGLAELPLDSSATGSFVKVTTHAPDKARSTSPPPVASDITNRDISTYNLLTPEGRAQFKSDRRLKNVTEDPEYYREYKRQWERSDKGQESKRLNYINQKRKKKGLPPLSLSSLPAKKAPKRYRSDASKEKAKLKYLNERRMEQGLEPVSSLPIKPTRRNYPTPTPASTSAGPQASSSQPQL